MTNVSMPMPMTTTTTSKPTRRPRRPRVVKPAAAPPAAAPKSKPKQETPAQHLKRQAAAAARTRYEDDLLFQMRAMRLPEPQAQFLWHPLINYRADFGWPRERLIVEVDGGTHLRNGHHNSGKGYEYDRVRDCEALCLGYTVLRVTPAMVTDGRAVAYIERVIHSLWARHGRERTA